MKIAITTDCHIQMLGQPKAELSRFMDLVLAEKADAFCVLGDKVAQEAPNVFAYGHITDYGQLRYAVFDTEAPAESNPTKIK